MNAASNWRCVFVFLWRGRPRPRPLYWRYNQRMGEPSRPPQPEESLFTAVREEAEPKPWAAIIIVLVLLAVLLGLFVLLARGPRRTAAGANPYATQISFSDAKTTQVQNFLGANVTYIEGAVSNNGDKTVTGSEVQVTFKNSLGDRKSTRLNSSHANISYAVF